MQLEDEASRSGLLVALCGKNMIFVAGKGWDTRMFGTATIASDASSSARQRIKQVSDVPYCASCMATCCSVPRVSLLPCARRQLLPHRPTGAHI